MHQCAEERSACEILKIFTLNFRCCVQKKRKAQPEKHPRLYDIKIYYHPMSLDGKDNGIQHFNDHLFKYLKYDSILGMYQRFTDAVTIAMFVQLQL